MLYFSCMYQELKSTEPIKLNRFHSQCGTCSKAPWKVYLQGQEPGSIFSTRLCSKEGQMKPGSLQNMPK